MLEMGIYPGGAGNTNGKWSAESWQKLHCSSEVSLLAAGLGPGGL